MQTSDDVFETDTSSKIPRLQNLCILLKSF